MGIANKLRDVGKPLAISQIAGKILSSLPESYARVRTGWQQTSVADRTMAILQSTLISEEKVIASYKQELPQNNMNAFQAVGTLIMD